MNDGWCRIDTDMPGGNLRILDLRWASGALHLDAEPDQRGTTEPWFWWCFRIVAEAKGVIHLTLPERRCIAGTGPMLRNPSGTWLRIPASDARHVLISIDRPGTWICAVAHPYQLADWREWIASRSGNRLMEPGTLIRTRSGMPLPTLRIGPGNPYRISVTARHHACESLASFVVEGMLDAWLDDDHCYWLRRSAELFVIPFVDLDGVESGDQGKARAPHDHNGDYVDFIYPETRAIAKTLPSWGCGAWRIALDLHCPWVGGGGHEHIYLVNCPDPARAARQLAFAGMVEAEDRSGLRYRAEQTLAWGVDWNTAPPERRRSFSRWAAAQDGIRIAAGIEIPYAVANGIEVTPDRCRSFGGALARAIARWGSTCPDEGIPVST